MGKFRHILLTCSLPGNPNPALASTKGAADNQDSREDSREARSTEYRELRIFSQTGQQGRLGIQRDQGTNPCSRCGCSCRAITPPGSESQQDFQRLFCQQTHSTCSQEPGLQPQGHSPVTPAPDGSSDKVGSVFSHAAQFTSSTLWVTETALKFREACNSPAGFSWGRGESPPGTEWIMRKIRIFFFLFLPFSSFP